MSVRAIVPASIRRLLSPYLARRRDLRSIRTWTAADDARRTFYAQFVAPGDLVFDVGANIGNRVKIFAKLGARVVAFEPQPYCASVLRHNFSSDPSIRIVPLAVGAARRGTLRINEANVISSMSPEFIAATTGSGRFNGWSDQIEVDMVGLDEAIGTFGAPVFIKIDVEGYEAEVLKSLTSPVKALSFEIIPEHLTPGLFCIDHLAGLADYRFQLSLGESMAFHLADWVDAATMKGALAAMPQDTFGDVYARRA